MPELLQRVMVFSMKAPALCQKTGPQMDRKSTRVECVGLVGPHPAQEERLRSSPEAQPPGTQCKHTQAKQDRSTLTSVFGALGKARSGNTVAWPSIVPFLFLENFQPSLKYQLNVSRRSEAEMWSACDKCTARLLDWTEKP